MKGSGVVFTHGKGISTPRVRHKDGEKHLRHWTFNDLFLGGEKR